MKQLFFIKLTLVFVFVAVALVGGGAGGDSVGSIPLL